MWRDRLDDDNLVITHDFLAILLGVRRPGITDVVHVLEGKGLIKSSRNLIRIVNLDGLREEANGFYGVPEAEYDRLIRNATATSTQQPCDVFSVTPAIPPAPYPPQRRPPRLQQLPAPR